MSALCLLALACSEPTESPFQRIPESASAKIDATAYTITDIGTYGGGSGAQALAVDKHGTIYGRFSGATGTPGSFRWTQKDGFENLGSFEGNPFLFFETNDHGMINGSTVTLTTPGAQRAVAAFPHTGFFYLDGTNTGSSAGSNDKGQIAGTRFGGGSAGWLWSEDTGVQLIPLSIPGRTVLGSSAGDVNESGAVAGTVTSQLTGGLPSTRTIRAYTWDSQNGTTVIPPLGPPNAGTFGPANVGVTFIGDDGLVLGASEMARATAPGPRPSPLSSTPGPIPVHAWKWSVTLGIVDLGTLGGKHSVAWDADKDGNVYGWASDVSGKKHAVKWVNGGGILDLGTLGGDALTGGLNKHGVVTGWSFAPDGKAHVVRYDPAK